MLPRPESLTRTLRPWWQREVALYTAQDATACQLRAKHLAVLLYVTPLMQLSNLLNAALMAFALAPWVGAGKLAAWSVAMVLAFGLSALHWRQFRRRKPTLARPRHIWRVVAMTAWMACAWAVLPLFWFPMVPAAAQTTIAVMISALMCTGAYFLATIPLASLTWVVVLTLSTAWALLTSPEPTWRALATVLAVYATVVCLSARIFAGVFSARFIAEREAERQGHMVGLLLRDFEDHATDMLWEIDRGGRLLHVSQRLAQMLSQPSTQITGRPLLEVIEQLEPPEREGVGLAAMRHMLTQDKPFRDLSVTVSVGPSRRWWSISAKPLVDETGRTVGWRGVISDVTQQQLAHQRLAKLAHTDSLTGLANRVQLRERVAAALDGAATSQRRSALICIDLDDFKAVNDTLGHSYGDDVLRMVAKRLVGVMRHSDLIARLGGDEFAVVLDDVRSDDEVTLLARRILQVLNQPSEVRGRAISVGASLGIAMLPDHGRSVDEALGNADLALYAAKEGGRGRAQSFTPWLGERSRRVLSVETALREALPAGQLSLHWQPRVSVESWTVTSAEVLLRWDHPQLGKVGPAEFIPLAEKSGLIAEIGAWVLEHACTVAQKSLPGLCISVNVSPVQLMRAEFMADVERALRRSGLPPNRLEIEITESVFVEDADLALRNLHGLKRLGVQIAMDDFGTGYSSLAYLRRFSFDTLKIDRAFVRELLTHHDARAIVRTIVDLARTLGMFAVAEGVEEPAQLEVLARAGVGAVQGYLMARPLPLPELQVLLANWRNGERPRTQDVPNSSFAPLDSE